MAIVAPKIGIDEFVTGEKFEEFCDIDAEKNNRFIDDIGRSKKYVLTVFTQTHELKNRIPQLLEIDKKFIIVSHNSDGNVRYGKAEREYDYQWKNEKNILHWFCQNCDVTEPNVTPIPIAVENTYIFKPEVKQQYMIDVRDSGIKKQIKIFICYNPGTNPAERNPPIEMFSDKPWATWLEGYNNIDLVKPYFDAMIRHQFVLCPDGNGYDTIRLWEALYLGCIPIVKPHVFTEYFAERLPIVIVNDWSEITLKFLVNKLQEMDHREYDLDMLKMSYWRKAIADKIPKE